MTTIVDTDTLIGLMLASDVHHEQVLRLYSTLRQDTIFYLLSDTLSEFATLATIKMGRERTQLAVSELVRSHVLITLEPETALDAIQLYQKQTSKENSLFDCAVMMAAQTLAVDCIFSFDKGYRQNGFMLVEEYLEKVSGRDV